MLTNGCLCHLIENIFWNVKSGFILGSLLDFNLFKLYSGSKTQDYSVKKFKMRFFMPYEIACPKYKGMHYTTGTKLVKTGFKFVF